MNLSQQIQNLRKRHNLTQEEWAEKIYISRQTISNWERGKSYPDIHSLLLLSVCFDVPLDYLVKGGIDKMKKVSVAIKYKRIANITNVFGLIGIFLMIAGRHLVGEFFSILMGLAIIVLVVVSRLSLRKIEIENEVKNTIYDPKSIDEVLFFLENTNLNQQEFEIKRKQQKKKRRIKWGLTVLGFLLFIVLSSYTSHLVAF